MTSRVPETEFPGFAALAEAFAHREPVEDDPDGPPPTLAELTARRDELLAVARRHGARNLRVVGSVARGDADHESDVDFLVDLDAGRSLLDVSGLVIDLEDLLGCRVQVIREAGLRRPEVRQRLLAEAVAL
jgi:predicted nucleotidyltransferase